MKVRTDMTAIVYIERNDLEYEIEVPFDNSGDDVSSYPDDAMVRKAPIGGVWVKGQSLDSSDFTEKELKVIQQACESELEKYCEPVDRERWE